MEELGVGNGNGRGDRIRTCDLFTPSEARYQAALRPDILPFGRRLLPEMTFLARSFRASHGNPCELIMVLAELEKG